MNKITILTLATGIALISCKPGSGTGIGSPGGPGSGGTAAPPLPIYAQAEILYNNYTTPCNQSFNNNKGPIDYVKSGTGQINLSVVGDNPVQFSHTTYYRPNTSGPAQQASVTPQNGTLIQNPHKLWVTYVDFEVPFVQDSYSLKFYFIEYGSIAPAASTTGNTSSCINAVSNKCYRRIKFLQQAAGTIPMGSNVSGASYLAVKIDQIETVSGVPALSGACN